MSKTTNQKIVSKTPKLRFPEFSGDWQEKKLGDVGQIITGKTPSTKNPEFWGGDITFITPTDIIEQNKYQTKTQRTITKQKNTKLLPTGSIAYTCIASIGKMTITTNETSSTNQQINSIIVNGKFNNEYIYYALLKLTPYIKSMRANTTLPIINKTEFSEFKIQVPSLKEQTKIANFLSSLDNLINTQTQKLALLKTYKKGLMQQLFPQEGEKLPKLRFPEFSGNWQEKKLGDMVNNVGGASLEKYTNPKAKYKFISIGNYGVNGKYIDNGQRIELNSKTKTKLLDKNNLVMILNDKTRTGDIIGSTILIGKSNNYIYNQRSERLICKSGLLPIFAWNYLNSRMFRKSVYSISQGGTQIYVNFSSVKRLTLKLPSLKEQTKIANFLSSIDNLINTQTQKLALLKTYKKGLMQQLFPAN